MPELPEVETIVRWLHNGKSGQPSIVGHYVQDICLLWHRTLAEPSLENFTERMAGFVIRSVSRRAKFIVIEDQNDFLVIHLRMSGDIRVEKFPESGHCENLETHDRFVMKLSNAYRFVFNDTRKFGRIWLVKDLNYLFDKLGPEPFDENLDASKFHQMLQAKKRQIKPLLMDQSFLAGMGNIYTDEALFLAGIHPLRISKSLTDMETAKLLDAIRFVLSEGIRLNGASIDWVYRGGEFQNTFNVYQKNGAACPNCGFPIQRIVVGQRGTHFCPHCQK